MGRAPHKKALERDNAKNYRIVEEALKTVQMDAFADRTFSTLSGGEQQRVILARALAQQTSRRRDVDLILVATSTPENVFHARHVRYKERFMQSMRRDLI